VIFGCNKVEKGILDSMKNNLKGTLNEEAEPLYIEIKSNIT